ncbi:hypothetical protein BJ741DRAFT_540761 [Chytriomyces cf. hyalinus JEL632]|nr:hypothetical protein BJ741DRAFT_540761 [Chytriomyces cf. hyalinus JEL632]
MKPHRKLLNLIAILTCIIALLTSLYSISIRVSVNFTHRNPTFEAYSASDSDASNSATSNVSIAIALKTGRETLHSRVPMQMLTFLRGHKQFLLLGDASGHALGITRMTDVLLGAWRTHLKKRSEALSKGRLAKRGSLGMGLDPAKDRVKSGEEDWSGGWALDAHKNLPGLKLVYKKYPNVDWYLMIDDDSYVMMDNLKMYLQKLDPNKKHYIGQMNRFKGCDGVSEYGTGPHFAQGGAGIVISRGAMVAMMENIDDCIVRYKDCWAGDIRVGLCLRDSAIPIHHQVGFHGIPPTKDFIFPTNPCEVPFVFHHVLPLQMQMLHSIELRIRSSTPQRQSTMGDVFQTFLPYAGTHENTDRPGGDFLKGSMQTAKECETLCIETEKCVAWVHDATDQKGVCWMKGYPPPIVEGTKGRTSGVITSRYVCEPKE